MDLGFELLDLGVDLGEGAGWDVLVEVAGERDLVADLGLGVVDPGVVDVGVDLGLEVVLDGVDVLAAGEPAGGVGFVPGDGAGGDGDVLLVAEVGVRFGFALAVGDDRGVGVLDGEVGPDGLGLGRGEAGGLQDRVDDLGDGLAVGVGERRRVRRGAR